MFSCPTNGSYFPPLCSIWFDIAHDSVRAVKRTGSLCCYTLWFFTAVETWSVSLQGWMATACDQTFGLVYDALLGPFWNISSLPARDCPCVIRWCLAPDCSFLLPSYFTSESLRDKSIQWGAKGFQRTASVVAICKTQNGTCSRCLISLIWICSVPWSKWSYRVFSNLTCLKFLFYWRFLQQENGVVSCVRAVQ